MSTRVCCISLCVGTGALVYCCRRIQEQIVCSERYAHPQPESSNLSYVSIRGPSLAGWRLCHEVDVRVCSLKGMLQRCGESCAQVARYLS